MRDLRRFFFVFFFLRGGGGLGFSSRLLSLKEGFPHLQPFSNVSVTRSLVCVDAACNRVFD